MIKSFANRSLAELFLTGKSPKVRADLHSRCLRRLDALNEARNLSELNIPGFNFHKLQGYQRRYTLHVNGPWCITFDWDGKDALKVDLEQYH